MSEWTSASCKNEVIAVECQWEEFVIKKSIKIWIETKQVAFLKQKGDPHDKGEKKDDLL